MTEEKESIKVLCVERGLGEYPEMLKEPYNVLTPKLPTSKYAGYEQLKEVVEFFKPDLLLAMCRGTKYAMNLILTDGYSGPILLLSPQWYQRFPEIKGCPILILHGTKDRCQKYSNIKGFVDQVQNTDLIKLVPFRGQGHELPFIWESKNPTEVIAPYIKRALNMGRKHKKKKKKKKKRVVRKKLKKKVDGGTE